MRRLDNLARIAALDPERDCWQIYQLTSMYEFPWDTTRALELALYRTYCVPSIGQLLDATGEFRERTQKRYDDTSLLLGEVLEHGPDSARGRAAVRRINTLHGRFAISNDDMRYVLSTFVFVPVRWIERFGWRPLTDSERLATYHYYCRLGALMGIRDIPPSYAAFERFHDDYERRHFTYSDATRRTGEVTRELFVRWFRLLPAPLVRLGVYALLDEPLLRSFGFPAPPRWLPPAMGAALRTRGALAGALPPRRSPALIRESWFVRSYPDGYEISELGPAESPDVSRTPSPAR